MNTVDGGKDVSPWLLTVPVAAWAAHFLAVYVVAAVYCAKSAGLATAVAAPLGPVRWPVIAVTLAALAIDAAAARRGHAARKAAPRSEYPSGDRRFLGSVTLMLCTLSAGATIGVAAVSLLFGDCRP